MGAGYYEGFRIVNENLRSSRFPQFFHVLQPDPYIL